MKKKLGLSAPLISDKANIKQKLNSENFIIWDLRFFELNTEVTSTSLLCRGTS